MFIRKHKWLEIVNDRNPRLKNRLRRNILMNYLSKIYMKTERFKRIRLQKLALRKDMELIKQVQPKEKVNLNFNLNDDPLKQKLVVSINEIRNTLGDNSLEKIMREKAPFEILSDLMNSFDYLQNQKNYLEKTELRLDD